MLNENMLNSFSNYCFCYICTMKNSIVISFFACLTMMSCVHAPQPSNPVPTSQQLEWQQLETYAFVHFGLNTFNDLEWGYGNTPASTFNPVELDCEQWVQTFKACGMKAVILTAKHHDGFCLWPTNTTDYNISNSPYKDGKGDLVRELSDACHKYGLKFGLYLSPWDRNNAEYGKEGYVETYHKQIEELTTNYGPLSEFWFDGANGGNGWYGGAEETRSIVANEYYDYVRARNTIWKNHPNAMIFGGAVPTIRWVGNEQGWASDTQWSAVKMSEIDDCDYLTHGDQNGDVWLPAEVDVSIRPGWFYHAREDHQVKSLEKLVDIYYRSVGHNANLLLNFPINLEGKISKLDSIRVMEWFEVIQKDLCDNLLKNCNVYASNSRSKKFNADNVCSDEYGDYWAVEDGIKKAELVFDFPERTAVNRVMLQEYIPNGQNVSSFSLERFINGKWLPIESYDDLTTIGYKRIVRFQTVKMDKLRIRFKTHKGTLCISKVAAFYAEPLLSEPTITRSYDNMVSMTCADDNAEIRYTLDGSEPSLESMVYKTPFELDSKAIVKAISVNPDDGKSSAVAVRELDLPPTAFKVVFPSDPMARRMFDDNGYTAYYLSDKKQYIELELNEKVRFSGVRYLPSQARDADQHITNYEIFVDGKMVRQGEFSNIDNNPIEQVVRFEPVEGKKLSFVAIRFSNASTQGAVAEFSVITD